MLRTPAMGIKLYNTYNYTIHISLVGGPIRACGGLEKIGACSTAVLGHAEFAQVLESPAETAWTLEGFVSEPDHLPIPIIRIEGE